MFSMATIFTDRQTDRQTDRDNSVIFSSQNLDKVYQRHYALVRPHTGA